ncbi:hypothetical protein [Bacillus sp. J33]|uniref:hypothetical protein n=1 Tax=Bacillus sp. J33 TaxID=935836 RepID=UPI00047A69AF|nr:hypothetical protein [Bacillus sp. J33]
MLKRYLVVTRQNRGHFTEDQVHMYERDSEVKSLVGRIASGDYNIEEEPKTLKSIHEIDLVYGEIKCLEPSLVNMKIVLKECDK